MVLEGYLKSIYENNIELILMQIPEVEKNGISIAYQKFLLDQYGHLWEDLLKEGLKDAEIEAMINDSEKKRWENLGTDMIRAELLPDQKLSDLKFLSELAFRDACTCMKQQSFLSDQKEYEKRLYEISQCLDGIKAYHLPYAKELLSETLLDMDYAYGKSEIKSLRLARSIGELPKPIFCMECGVKNSPGAVFCKGCGNRLN